MQFVKNTWTKLIFLLLICCLPLIASSVGNTINVIEVDSIINPVSAEYIVDSIKTSEKESAQCLIIKLDTPGGLDTSMRQIIKEMRIMASRNSEEINEAVEDGKRRMAKLAADAAALGE